ncbi:MAG: hypothetical protein KDB79_14800 [Acidobacteria bacterium]|nr:hypothetical protein [Acidobacteriota bacterium]
MSRKRIFAIVFCLLLILTIGSPSFAQSDPDLEQIYKEAKTRRGKRPLIIIPGIMGSELINKETGEKVWFSFSRSDKEDLRLPIALNLRLSQDRLIPGDIIRKIDIKLLPDVEVYKGIIDTLTKFGGYEEASWEDPPKDLEDKIFVFPYDWRRDNVETAQFLLEEIEELKRKTHLPNIKFNVLAHSMGGLVARYAAMYGKSDLPNGRPQPNWSGEKHFGKMFFFGTPNEGSAEAMDALLRGKSSLGGSAKVPFIRYLTPVDIATMPSVFQLLPHPHTSKFFDEDLNPINIDLYDVKTWRKFKWAIFGSDEFNRDFTEAEQGRFEQYFSLVLKRAKKFHEALNARSTKRPTSAMFAVGSDCLPTLNALVLYQDTKDKNWVTLTQADAFRNSKGVRFSTDQLKRIMFAPGDGSVTRRSLLAETLAENGNKRSAIIDSALPLTSALFVCENHERITNNTVIQNNVLTALISEATRDSDPNPRSIIP